jgi:deoxyribose-phosphate aldolase
MPLELDWIEDVRVNRECRRAPPATLRTRRTVKKEWQAASLLRAVTLMDLTTLAGTTPPAGYGGSVLRRRPLREDLLEAMGATQPPSGSARCVYHTFVETALEALSKDRASRWPLCPPDSRRLSPLAQRLGEIRRRWRRARRRSTW